MNKEIWVDSIIFPSYYLVSNKGRVKSKNRKTNGIRFIGKLLFAKKNCCSPTRDFIITLYNEGRNMSIRRLALVWNSFNPENTTVSFKLAAVPRDGNWDNAYLCNISLLPIPGPKPITKMKKALKRIIQLEQVIEEHGLAVPPYQSTR